MKFGVKYTLKVCPYEDNFNLLTKNKYIEITDILGYKDFLFDTIAWNTVCKVSKQLPRRKKAYEEVHYG